MTEQTLGDVALEVWRGRIFVLCGVLVGAICAAAFLYVAAPHYRASMILSPATPMGALSAGLRTADDSVSAGLAVNDGAMFTRFEAMYKGASVAGLLLRDERILGGLKRDKAFVFSAENDKWNAPNLAEYIARRVVVDPIGETDLRAFYYEHVDPDFAAVFVQQIHAVTDGLIRYEMRRDVNERIDYLRDAIAGVKNPEHRRGLTALLMEQERLKMLVSINQAYAASVVEPSVAMGRVFWPSRSLVVSVFLGVGAFLGFVFYSIAQAQRYKGQKVERRAVKEVQQTQRPPPGESAQSRDLAERSRRKMQEWIKRDSGNNNDPVAAKKSKPSAAE